MMPQTLWTTRNKQ